jgi:hypothetical protein
VDRQQQDGENAKPTRHVGVVAEPAAVRQHETGAGCNRCVEWRISVDNDDDVLRSRLRLEGLGFISFLGRADGRPVG